MPMVVTFLSNSLCSPGTSRNMVGKGKMAASIIKMKLSDCIIVIYLPIYCGPDLCIIEWTWTKTFINKVLNIYTTSV